jgi:recombination protein RecT
VLQACTRDSIANALLDMAVQGLNPAKKQGYFIAYGKQLVFPEVILRDHGRDQEGGRG